MSTINDFLQKNKSIVHDFGYTRREHAPRIVCADGFNMSVQVSNGHYCTPRENDSAFYTSVEIGYPSEAEPLILEFAEDAEQPTETVYGYVPFDVVDTVIEKHGGIKTAENNVL